jgi:hypothetical protein
MCRRSEYLRHGKHSRAGRENSHRALEAAVFVVASQPSTESYDVDHDLALSGTGFDPADEHQAEP